VKISANSVLPARRERIEFVTSDGLTLVGELALPLDTAPVATIICVHPLPTHGGMMDSHVLRKMSWRLPALANVGVLRFNTRGTTSAAGTSDGAFDESRGEGLDLQAAVAWAVARGLTNLWLVGWSFGTDVVLRHGDIDPVRGAILLSPPLRFTSVEELKKWNNSPRKITALVPEHDDFLPPAPARAAFAVVPGIDVVVVDEAGHLWVGEKFVARVLDEIVQRVNPPAYPLASEWDGPMEKWSDL
jgi:alpha/beta superfamily hydrolase